MNHLQYIVVALVFSLFACNNAKRKQQVYLESRLIFEDSSLAIDSSLLRAYQPYKQRVDSLTLEVIGVAECDMLRGVPEGVLNNWVSDLMIKQSNRYLKQQGSPLVEISLMNNFGLRAPILKGDITIGNVLELMPFDNMLVVAEIKGSDLLDILNVLAESGGISLGGIRWVIENKRAAQVMIGGVKLDQERIYRLVTSDYIVHGGDKMIREDQVRKETDLGITIRSAITREIKEYTKANQGITAKLDGRVYVR